MKVLIVSVCMDKGEKKVEEIGQGSQESKGQRMELIEALAAYVLKASA